VSTVKTRPEMFSGCKEGIREDDRTRNCSKSGDLAAIIGLSTRGLFWIATQYGIFRILRISGEKILYHHRSSSDISSDSCCGREYPENGDHNAVRNVRIPGVFRSAERRTDFSEFVDEVLRGLDFVCAYIDNILIASPSVEEHLEHLQIFFERLRTYGVVIRIFGQIEVEFLGYLVIDEGTRLLPTREAIRESEIGDG